MAADVGPTGGRDREADRLQRAREVYFAVREMDLAAREEAIDRACGGDAELREVVLLLFRGEQAPLPIEALADELQAAAALLARTADTPAGRDPRAVNARDKSIGNYRLLERLGEGGFGVVFLAEQDKPVRRRVALKIIKLGMDTKQVVARFEAERQALALMDHPNIAKVFDAGATETGRPYFVMELVRGLPITEYCDQKKLGIRERLGLVAQVCEALQHAHQRGVIHRDIKPSNVIVSTVEGDKPVPKVIDFGIAKATSARLTEQTIFTEFRQMIGTPEYMSPEQAGQSAEDVDTRTDVYAAGVLLYELLTGVTPFDSKRLRSAAYGEMQRIIREEDPPKPSTRVGGGGGGATRPETLDTVAQKRSMPPTKLTSTIQGELDWIVMKAIEKDRARRYDSAGSMAADIHRYLSGHAVLAAPPGRTYLMRKFVRRHRGPVIAGSLLAIALVAGLVGTSLGFFNAEQRRKDMVKERDRADENATQARTAEAIATRNAYAANLISASTAMNAVQFSAARAALDAAPESLRGWEWRVLHARLDTSVRTVRVAPPPATNGLGNLVMHPDGRSFFTLDGIGEFCAQRWDVQTGRLLQSFPTPFQDPGQDASWATISTDGSRMWSLSHTRIPASKGIPVDSWDLSTGLRIAHMDIASSDPGFAEAIAGADGARIYTYTPDHVRSIDTATGKVLREQPMDRVPYVLACSTDSAMIVDATRATHLWRMIVRDTRSLTPLVVLDGHSGVIQHATFSADNRWLASSADDATARIWDLGARPPSSIVLPHPFRVGRAYFSPDASLVATIALDRAIRVWERASGRLLGTYANDTLDPYRLMFLPDGRTVAGHESDGTVRFWNIGAESTSVLRGHKSIVSKARWVKSEAGLIASASWEGADGSLGIVRLWDADSGDEVAVHSGRPGDIAFAFALSSDGRRASIGITNQNAADQAVIRGKNIAVGRIETLDLTTGHIVATPSMLRTVRWMAFAADDRSVIAADTSYEDQFRLHTFDTQTGALLRSRELDSRCMWKFGRGPTGGTIAAVPLTWGGVSQKTDRPQTVLVIDAMTLQTVREIDGIPEGQYCISFNADGTRFATGSVDGLLRVFDASSGALLASLSGHAMQMLAVAFSPDGTRIASAGVDRKVRIWNAATFEQVGVFAGHEGHIGDLDWDATGERLVSCSGDFTVRVWEPVPIRTRVHAREARAAALLRIEPKVAALFDELKDAPKVIQRISADQSLSPLDRRTALQVVISRALAAAPSLSPDRPDPAGQPR